MAITSRSAERIEAAAAAIGATGLVHDSEDLDGTPRLVAAVERPCGAVDVLVTNTGGPPAGPDPLGFGARRSGRPPTGRSCSARWRSSRRLLPGHARARLGPGGERRLDLGARADPGPHALQHPPRRAASRPSRRSRAQVAADGVTMNTVLPGRIATDRLYALYGGARGRRRRRARGIPAGAARHARRDARPPRSSCARPARPTSRARRCASTAG